MTIWMFQISSNKALAFQRDTDTGHRVAFTTTVAGNMSQTVLAEGETADTVQLNRRAIEKQLGIHAGTTQFVSQIHSAVVMTAAERGWADQATLGEADAIVSPDGTQPLGILVADCLPVAFTTDFHSTAIAHAGRVGLLNGILENTVHELRRYDESGTGSIQAIIGPGICGECYEVPVTMQTQAADSHPNIVSTTSWGTPGLNLAAAAADILTNLGLEVINTAHCTMTNSMFYSHRRQPGAGRIAGFVTSLNTAQ